MGSLSCASTQSPSLVGRSHFRKGKSTAQFKTLPFSLRPRSQPLAVSLRRYRTVASSSLYEQIGGEAAVDAVVDKFYEILLQDLRVSKYFSTKPEHRRMMQKAFLNHVLGGKPYDGLSMREAHQQQKLTDEHFDAVAEDLLLALQALGVPEEQTAQIMAVVASTRADVLAR